MTILVNIGNASRWQFNIKDADASCDSAECLYTCGCKATECQVVIQEQGKSKQVLWRRTDNGNLADRFEIYKCRGSRLKSMNTNVQQSQILKNDGLAVKSTTTKETNESVKLQISITDRSSELSSDGPQGSDQTSKQNITEYFHLLAIEKSDSFVKPVKKLELPKCALPQYDAPKFETPTKSKNVLPPINVLVKLKSRVKQLTGGGISEEVCQ